VLAGLALCGCVTTSEVPDDRFVRFFDEFAFGSAVDRTQRDRLARWDGPLEYSVVGEPSFSDTVATVMAVTARVAGIESGLNRLTTGGIEVRQEPAGTTFPVNRDRTDCYVHYRRKGDRIVGADIHVAASEPARVLKCLFHEAFHTMGMGHSGVIASVMSPFHAVEFPTHWDFMALRFLMSKDLSPGMPRAQVLAVLRRELPALRAAVAGRYSGEPRAFGENKT
jgi:hypothetical protein